MDDDKILRQLQLEDMSSGLGVTRYNKARPLPWRDDTAKERQETELVTGKQLMKRVLPRMTEAIEEFVKMAGGGKAGRKHTSYYYMVGFKASELAYMTARTAINAMVKHSKFVGTAMALSGYMEDHMRLTEMEQGDDAGLLSATLWKMNTSHGRHRQQSLRRALKEVSVQGLGWSSGDRLNTGSKLLEIFIEETGLAQMTLKKEGRRTVYYLEPTEQAKAWLDRMHEEQALLAPIFLPTIIPPRDWVSPVDGGYYSDLLARRVIMMRTAKKNTVDELFSTDMPEVYNALNAVQKTAWRINNTVYKTAREVWRGGGGLGGMPDKEDEPIPARPAHIPSNIALSDLSKEDQKILKKWKRTASMTYTDNAKLMSKRMHVAQQLWVAGTFVDEEEIFFPHNMDFRGRIYSIPSGVSPQSDDLGKALLEFAEAQPLGKDGAFWLAVHVANVWGVADKLPLSERVMWVRENLPLIMDSAIDPLDGQRFWTTADGGDNAWQALAAAEEYTRYVLEDEKDTFMTRLPIAMDGSCSGLQHFSAMLLDEVGGDAVNLIPRLSVQDIYSDVARRVEGDLGRITDNDMSKEWKGKVTRKIVKQPCMTFAYSVTSVGIRDQIVDALRKQDPDGDYLDGVDYFTGASYLAPFVENAIRGTVIAASDAMEWLKVASGILAEENLPIMWTTPVGLPIRQDEVSYKLGRQHVWFQGRKIQFRLAYDTDRLDKRRQKSGIAPNFVHSMDAAHLMKTVNASVAEGIFSFAMIHDSFGTHAGRVTDLNRILREEFVAMYSNDILGYFREQMEEQIPDDRIDELEEVPPKGSLDLAGVLESTFFFA